MKIILVLAYVSMYGVSSIETYERTDMQECRKEAKSWYDQVRVGSGRAWCDKVAIRRKEHE